MNHPVLGLVLSASFSHSSPSMYLWETRLLINTFHYVTTLLSVLQWLPISFSPVAAHLTVQAKILKMADKAPCDLTPAYLLYFLLTLLQPHGPSCCFRHYCLRVFVLAIPSAWNTLPLSLFIVSSLTLSGLSPKWVLPYPPNLRLPPVPWLRPFSCFI